MSPEAVFWQRYQNVRDRVRVVRDQVDLAGHDLKAVVLFLPEGSYPESDWDELVKDVDELARHVREVRETARAKHVNGREADRNIDAIIVSMAS